MPRCFPVLLTTLWWSPTEGISAINSNWKWPQEYSTLSLPTTKAEKIQMKTTFLLFISCISLTSASCENLAFHVLLKALMLSKSIFCTLQWSESNNAKRANLVEKLLFDIQITLLHRNSNNKCSIFIYCSFLGWMLT